MKAPFPYFGGKATIAAEIWRRFGAVQNYVEPFFGSGAVLLNRPDWTPGMTETVNDIDGMLCNFWRAIQFAPEETAHHADWPVNECDIHARHAWLVGQREDITTRLMGDPDWYDAKAAGWWCWGLCAWIGGGWCSGEGPWASVDGVLVRDAVGGIKRQRPHLGWGEGINRQRPHLGDRGQWIADWFAELSHRLRDVRVCCGEWSRICGPSPTTCHGLTAVFFDPPYASARDAVYVCDDFSIARDVRDWCAEHGDDPLLRIALCGYAGEHELPGWTEWKWKAQGGYGTQGNGRGRDNAKLETVWFSPHCLTGRFEQQCLWAVPENNN